MKKLISILFLSFTLLFSLNVHAAKVAVIYDSGGKFDKSFNESAYNAAEKFKADTGNDYMDFEAANNAQIEQGLRKLVDRGANVIVAMGFAMADAVSAVAGQGIRFLLQQTAQMIDETPIIQSTEEMPVYRPESDSNDFEIRREADGVLRVSGVRIERAVQMTYWEYDDAVLRFQRILESLGIRSALHRQGIREGDVVRIGTHELEWIE